jgi:hypothetical protein
MNVSADTIDEYFAAAGEREPALRTVDEVIKKAAPNLKPVLFGGMTGKMLGYGMQPYQSKSMKEPIEWPLIALANQKNYVSLYVMALEDGEYVAEKNAGRLGRVSVGKSCIRFKKLEDLNLEVVDEIIGNVARRVAAGEKLFGI